MTRIRFFFKIALSCSRTLGPEPSAATTSLSEPCSAEPCFRRLPCCSGLDDLEFGLGDLAFGLCDLSFGGELSTGPWLSTATRLSTGLWAAEGMLNRVATPLPKER